MLPGDGITAGDGKDKTCYPGSAEYKFKYGSEGLNTSDIQEYIRNPHKFNLYYVMDGQYYNLWSTDNERTDNNDEVVIKSVYDPSPVGYSLPASNAFTGFTTTGGNVDNWPNPLTPETKAKLNVKGNWDKGWYLYTKPDKQGIPFFFYATGRRENNSGILKFTFQYGHYRSAGTFSINDGIRLGFSSVGISPIHSFSRNFAFTVRSAEEKIVLVRLR